ncbi:Yip1 domain-containing protein [Aquimarina amphilecti]|uniref:Yip1 domain-containing protein n=1 Tax=Aquimarina amphilecti TaxID=1038014 RepID=A0A1H7QLK1_AQUAM|nr:MULTISPECIES: Yip1 family protein [Aquimarina]MBQ4804676.1 YIP1 family protein [Aquimarina sp. MMG015]SEL48822.1 Yip1 domain-containing protein [Aquimarina amphilecti]
MNNELTDSENSQSLTDKDIFVKIWTSPRTVFKFINDNQYDKYVNILLFFAGISRAFDRASLKDTGDTMSLFAIIGFCVFFGGLLGWISYYIYSALLSWTGKWIKGQGDTKSILRIISYAMIPAVIGLIFLIPQIGIYGNEMFKSNGDIVSAGLVSNIFVYGALILEFILGIWTIIFCVVGVSEVQKLSIGKTILNLLLPFFVFMIPIVIIILIFQI